MNWKELKERRLTQIVVTYLAIGWMALTGLDQVVDRGVLEEIVYRVALLAYIGGIPSAIILGWFHGEKGRQNVTVGEVVMLAGVFALTGLYGVGMVRDYRAEERIPGVDDFNARFDPRRVAVLYFDDLSRGAEDAQFIADGFTESLIDELGRVRELDVVSRNGVEPFRGEDVTPDSVGRALAAGSVIDGSVEPAGDRIRVTVRLIESESGVDLDRTSFTVGRSDLLATQDSLAAAASRFLRTRLGEEIRIRERRAQTVSVDAWTLVQRAERLRKDADDARLDDSADPMALLDQADSLLATAEGLDPSWIAPIVARAEVSLRRGIWAHSLDDALAAVDAGVDFADRAIERDATYASALAVRGTLRHFHYYLNASPTPQARALLLDQAQADLERATQLDGSLAGALSTLSRLYIYDRGRSIDGAVMAQRALDADSYLRDAAATLDRLFWATYDLGQFDQARRTCREAAARFPDDHRFQQCELWLQLTPTVDPDPASAWTLVARVDSLTPPAERPFVHSVSQMVVGGILARAGQADSARAVLEAARAGPEVDPGQELPGYEAIMRTILGEEDEAVQQLRRYASANPDHRRFEVEGALHWWWRPLRDHPGFQSVVGR